MNSVMTPSVVLPMFGSKPIRIKKVKSIDEAYAKELKEIQARKMDRNIFDKVDASAKMEKVKDKIQISIDTMV